MDPDAITQYITDTFPGVDVVVADGNAFYFYDPDPDRDRDPARTLPFATLVTSDAYDQFSDLDRPGVFRLNIGIARDMFRSLFGPQPPPANASEGDDRGYDFDFTASDQIMPHPVYGTMFWVCVLNPSAATFQAVRPLLAEAYNRAAKRPTKARFATDS